MKILKIILIFIILQNLTNLKNLKKPKSKKKLKKNKIFFHPKKNNRKLFDIMEYKDKAIKIAKEKYLDAKNYLTKKANQFNAAVSQDNPNRNENKKIVFLTKKINSEKINLFLAQQKFGQNYIKVKRSITDLNVALQKINQEFNFKIHKIHGILKMDEKDELSKEDEIEEESAREAVDRELENMAEEENQRRKELKKRKKLDKIKKKENEDLKQVEEFIKNEK